MFTSKVLIWDLPTRIFHWLLTVGLVACFAFAEFSTEHSYWFSAHIMIGIVLGLMLVLRVGWGIIGSRYARFGSFLYGPSAVLSYLRGAVTGKEHRYIGHNPGSAYAIFVMLILLGMVVVTGLMMSGGGEAAEELHEISSYALLAIIAVHIVGVAWYSLRQGENLTLSMFTGIKVGEPGDAIPSSRPISAVIFVVVIGYVTVSLFQNYDHAKRQTKLPFVNTVVSLGEFETGEAKGHDDD